MDTATMIRLKHIVTLWLLAGNGLLVVWALVAYFRGGSLARTYFNIVVFLQILIVALGTIGFLLISRGVGTNPGHIMYGALNVALAVARIGFYGPLMNLGRSGMLWQGLLAFVALALVGRSSVTALYQ